jgi:hypothetical protein
MRSARATFTGARPGRGNRACTSAVVALTLTSGNEMAVLPSFWVQWRRQTGGTSDMRSGAFRCAGESGLRGAGTGEVGW